MANQGLRMIGVVRGFDRICWSIVLASLVLIALTAAAARTELRHQRELAMANATTLNTQLVAAYEHWIRQTLISFDNSLIILRQDVLANPQLSNEELLARFNPLKLRGGMETRIAVTDIKGNLILASYMTAELEQKKLNFSDRAYFQFHATHTDDDLYLGVPVLSRVDGRLVLPVSRRITLPDGSFGGVVVTSVEFNNFAEMYAKAGSGLKATRAISGLDGMTRIRQKDTLTSYGDNVGKSQVFTELRKAASGSFIAKSALSGVLLIVSYNMIPPYSLVTFSGISVDEVNSQIADSARAVVFTALFCCAMLAALASLLVARIVRQKLAVDEMQRSAVRYQRLYELTPVMHVSLALRGTDLVALACNEQLASILGYSRTEIVGCKVNELMSPTSSNHNTLLANYQRVLDGFTHTEPITLLTREGHSVYTLAQMTQHLDPSDTAASIHAVLIDISSSEILRESLLKSEQNFRGLIELIPQLVVTLNPQGDITWVNARAIAYCGVAQDAQAAPFLWLRQAMHADERLSVESLIRKIMHSGLMSQPFEFHLRRFDGDYRWFSALMMPISNASGKAVSWLATLTDIHDYKMAGERMQVMQRVESIGQLTGGLAHDFNNLLAIIIGNLDLVKDNAANAKNHKRIQIALTAAERGEALVKSLLAIASKQPLDPCVTELGSLLDRLVPLMCNALGASVQFTLLPCDEATFVKVDQSGLDAALLNVAVNANDAMPGGGTLTVGVSRRGDMAVITLQDNGCGMSEAVCQKAIDPFFTTKPLGKGNGLGLSMVAGFVKQSGGELKIHTLQGAGCRIEIFLPMTLESRPDLSSALPKVLAATPSGVILVVDDEAELAHLVCEWLNDWGFTTLCANSAQEALALLVSAPVDLVISDVAMPGQMDGLALADKVRAQYPQTQILLMSGYAIGQLSGASNVQWAVLAKPLQHSALLDAVVHILQRNVDKTP